MTHDTVPHTPVPLRLPLHRHIHRLVSGRIDRETPAMPAIDFAALERDLRAAVADEVRFDAGERAIYATDSSNYRQVPLGVVLPKTRNDVIRAVEVCRRFDVPVLPRGCGTSLAGECCNTAVVIDFSKYLNRVLEIDFDRRVARVEPGCILDHLREEAGKHGLTFGPDPATHDHNTLGGMIGNDSGGVHTLMNGITVFNVEAMEVLTYDGLVLDVGPTSPAELRSITLAGGRRAEIYRKLQSLSERYAEQIRERFPQIPRRVTTCVTMLEATLTLVPARPERVLVMLAFPDIFLAADAVPEVLQFKPIALEGFDDILIDRYKEKRLHTEELKVLPNGGGWLLAEFGADTEEQAEAQARELLSSLQNRPGIDARIVTDKAGQARFWALRDDSLGAESYVPNHPDTWPGWADSAVSPSQLGVREFKAIWDSGWRMNPGKVVDPFPITSNLRVGPDYKPPELRTHFAYINDKGSFARAAQRCVGTGKCRRHDSGHEVMCPSFLVTHEEQYTTRGRSRLLFEMLHGGVVEKGWRSDAVEEALRLCLACKGCRHDCPVNVDMATYKAEFRSHYYAGRLRPR